MSDFLFDNMIKFLRNTICGFPDIRTGSNTTYSIEDPAYVSPVFSYIFNGLNAAGYLDIFLLNPFIV